MLSNEISGRRLPSVTWLLLPVLVALIMIVYSIPAFLNPGEGNVVVVDFKLLSYLSLFIFLVCLVLGMVSDALYFTFLVFVLLAFPAPVNDFIPGVYLGDPREEGAAVFPFITHIDIFLIFGIIKGFLRKKRFVSIRSPFLIFVIVCLFLSVTINYFAEGTRYEKLLLLAGAYQLRYLIELLLLISLFRIGHYKNQLLLGFLFSIVFLLLEAMTYTYTSHAPALSSGSLANNTYASIIAAILLFLLIIRRNYGFSQLYRGLLSVGMLVAVVTVLSTGARMAVLAFVITYFMYRYIKNRKRTSFRTKLNWGLSIVLFVIVVSVIANFLPKRYNPKTIAERIHFKQFSTDIFQMVKIDPSWETSSLMTRQRLYATSLKMFERHTLAGIGPGRWNYLKKEYGFPEFLLIDSHNGYLSILSQYGLLGVPLLLLFYVYPWVILIRQRNILPPNFLFWLALINAYISIADLSNSGIFKHQIFSVLALNLLVIMSLHDHVLSTEPVDTHGTEPVTE